MFLLNKKMSSCAEGSWNTSPSWLLFLHHTLGSSLLSKAASSLFLRGSIVLQVGLMLFGSNVLHAVYDQQQVPASDLAA